MNFGVTTTIKAVKTTSTVAMAMIIYMVWEGMTR